MWGLAKAISIKINMLFDVASSFLFSGPEGQTWHSVKKTWSLLLPPVMTLSPRWITQLCLLGMDHIFKTFFGRHDWCGKPQAGQFWAKCLQSRQERDIRTFGEAKNEIYWLIWWHQFAKAIHWLIKQNTGWKTCTICITFLGITVFDQCGHLKKTLEICI